MIAAAFLTCVMNIGTNSMECSNSYTDMSTVADNKTTCMAQAKKLGQGAVNSVLLADPNLVLSVASYQCGSLKDMRKLATDNHQNFLKVGIHSVLFGF